MTKLSDGTVIASAFRGTGAQINQGFDQVKRVERLKIGTIIAVRTVDSTEGLQKSANNSSEGVQGTAYETVYDVRVDDHNARPFIFNGCRATKPFMGANNYFDMIHESSDLSVTYMEKIPGPVGGVFASAAESLMGSRCVILCIEGEPTAPVILGFLQHPARKSPMTKDKGLHMEFEFNGMKVSIDKDGAFKLLGNGPYIPTITLPVGPVPQGVVRQNPLIGPFSIEITKDMQFILKDNMNQMISVDRQAMTMEFTNGAESIKLTKSLIPKQGAMAITVGGKLTTSSTDTEFDFAKSFSVKTLEFKLAATTSTTIETGSFKFSSKLGFDLDAMTVGIKAKTSFSVETTTMSFKGKTGELLTVLKEILDGIGTCTPSSPVGPCAPIQASPQWPTSVAAALVKLQGMMG